MAKPPKKPWWMQSRLNKVFGEAEETIRVFESDGIVADPGQVLKIRQAPGYLNLTVGNALVAYQILYRSTDSQYNPTFDVTTLFIPLWQYRCSPNTTSLCAHAVLSYQLPYDTCNVDASPSYGSPAWSP